MVQTSNTSIHLKSLNPLNPKSDQHLVSPDHNTAESFICDHENIGNDHQLKKLLIVNQILLASSLGNVQISVQRMCILMLGCKGIKAYKTHKFRNKKKHLVPSQLMVVTFTTNDRKVQHGLVCLFSQFCPVLPKTNFVSIALLKTFVRPKYVKSRQTMRTC